jgi:hypothetical protein
MHMQDELKFPPPSSTRITPSTVQEVQTTLKLIRNLDLRAVAIDEIKSLLPTLWRGYAFVAPILQAGISLYRLRSFDEDKPRNVSEISAPPPSKVHRNQRCNRAGESLFYCSTAINAPFFELHAQVGQNLVLSTWKTTRPLLVNRVGYTPSAFLALRAARDCPTWHASLESQGETEASRAVDEFLAEQFTTDVQPGDEYLYKLTVAFSEKLLHGGNFSFDGLLYPTIPMWGNADNLALTASATSGGLRFVHAEYLKMKTVESPTMTFDTLDTATSVLEDGLLSWKGHPDQWTLRNRGDRLTLSNENGCWVARDLSGQIVEPD